MSQEHMIVEETARRWLSERGVTIPDIADLVYGLQKDVRGERRKSPHKKPKFFDLRLL